MGRSLEAAGFAAAIIDALSSHICVVDREGIIVAVNRAWREFGGANAGRPCSSGVGVHYLQVCGNSSGAGADEADDFALGVRAVLQGKSDLFQLEYPCHSPTESRWFLGSVTPLKVEQGGAVISHMNITDRKVMEFELSKLAATDVLTGLPNRRYFLEAAARELQHVRRFATPACVMIIDIDHFKVVNDTYGHAAGDAALRSVARAFRLRDVDTLARWGGEEFAAILPGADLDQATEVAEALRHALSETSVDVAPKNVRITASFGVAQVSSGDRDIGDALGRADHALYDAKAAGRDCVRSIPNLHFRTGKLHA